MTTVNTNYQTQQQLMGGTPFGNTRNLPYNLTTVSGVASNTDLATALQANDVVRLGILPKGLSMQDALIIRSVVFTATSTGDIGFAYVDGVDLTGADAQDAAYFAASLALDATGVTRKTGVKAPITLKKDAYLIVTNKVAAQAANGVLDVIVQGIDTGGN